MEAPDSPSFRQIAAGPFLAETPFQARDAGRAAAAALKRPTRRSARINAAAAPLLTRSALGARLGALPAHRAAAIGAPPAACPNAAAFSAPSPARAATGALRACLANRPAHVPEPCPCVLLALDDAVFAPRAALSYAPGVAAQLLGADAPAGLLVAEEIAAPGLRRIVFRDAGGVLARADAQPDGAVALRYLGRVWRGRVRAFGRLRGRLVERWRVTDPQGRKLTALIGFEPGALP